MSLKVCTSAQGWRRWKLLVPLPLRPTPRQMGRFSGETQTAVITGLGTVLRMKAKNSIQALQPAGTGQREGRALPCRGGSNPVSSSSPAGSRRELAHFWQCRWESGKEQRLQGKLHGKGWSSARFHPKEPHNSPACKRGNSAEVCFCSWGDFWQKNGRDLPSGIQQNRSTTSKERLTQQHFHASGILGWETLSSNPWPKGSFWEAVTVIILLRLVSTNSNTLEVLPSLAGITPLAEEDKHGDLVLHESFLMGTGCQPSVL